MFTNIFDSTNKCVSMIGMHCPYHVGDNALMCLLVTVGVIGICTYAQQGSFNGYRLCRAITVRCATAQVVYNCSDCPILHISYALWLQKTCQYCCNHKKILSKWYIDGLIVVQKFQSNPICVELTVALRVKQ